MDARDPISRLSSAYRIEVDPETKERHVAAVSTAIRTAPPTPVPAGFNLRRRVAAAVAAVAIVAPAGMAVAAEDSVPGDFLYPVKEVTERVRSYVDRDIGATHRVEEVERLIVLQAPSHSVSRAVERAESATGHIPESGELRLRLEMARQHLQLQDEAHQEAVGGGSDDDPQESDSNSGRVGPGAGPGTTAPSGPVGSPDQSKEGSGTTGATLGSGQTDPANGDAAGSMAGPGATSSTTTP